MKRRVIVVDGPLAFRMRRVEAARASALGLEVLSLPLLATRLAGGFRRFADIDLLGPAIAEALGKGNFKDIDSVRGPARNGSGGNANARPCLDCGS
jgi:hypothetical protein